MLAIASTPVPGPALAEPRTEPSSVPFFGRSLIEYTQFFALDLPALRGRDVLDVAAGPSSFTAEACARKIDAVALDPRYGSRPEALADQVRLDYERVLVPIRAKPRMFRLNSFPSMAAAELDWRGAAQRFLADYATHFIDSRYVSGALPRLPFFDGTFDLVLCAHFLFQHPNLFDHEWHLAACRELVRVSVDEVRLYPLGGADGRTYPGLVRLRRELRESGIVSAMRAVGHGSATGGSSMLVLRRAAS